MYSGLSLYLVKSLVLNCSVSLVAYVAEDVLVSHQWEERLLGLPQFRGMSGPGSRSEWVGEQGRGGIEALRIAFEV